MNIKNLGIVVAAVLVVAVGGYFLMDSSSSAPEGPSTKEFSLRIVEKKVVEGPATITVKQGDTVVINVMSDEAEEFHVHGYDRSVDLEPNEKATLTFVADGSGRFPFELEESKTDLGALEVLPQ